MPLRISSGSAGSDIKNRALRRSSSRLAWAFSILYILYSLEVGLFLMMIPWHEIWGNNFILLRYPGLRVLVLNPFFKGAVLGLGIVNLLIGCQEIVQLRKGPRGFLSR